MLARITSIGKTNKTPSTTTTCVAVASTTTQPWPPVANATSTNVATPPSYYAMTSSTPIPAPYTPTYYIIPDPSHVQQQPMYPSIYPVPVPSYTVAGPPVMALPSSSSTSNATNGTGTHAYHNDGKGGVPIKDGKLEAMIFSAVATATKKIKARGLVGEVKVMGKVFGLTLHMSVTVERMTGEEVACDDAAIGNAEERNFFKRKLEKAIDKMLTSSEKLARRMRMRGLRGSVGGSLEITIWSIGIAIEIDISLESLEVSGAIPSYDTQPIVYTGLPPMPAVMTPTPTPTHMYAASPPSGYKIMHPHQQ